MLAKTELNECGQFILEMIDHIKIHGWCVGRLTCEGRVCVMGAAWILHDAGIIGGISTREEVFTKAITLLYDELGPVHYWNDTPGRTKDQVLDKLTEIAYTQIKA